MLRIRQCPESAIYNWLQLFDQKMLVQLTDAADRIRVQVVEIFTGSVLVLMFDRHDNNWPNQPFRQ
ncbi:hypothetical protein FHS15_001991 [Paenibacillus castaneae]|nr:hypothetical protein [Paenibacillus castaneae]